MDSRQVTSGALFCCVRGEHADGHAFAENARAAGAVALLVDHVLETPIPQIVVRDVRESVGTAAATHFGHPSRSMTIVGVTGTNGKTTTSLLLANILQASGRRVETLGTLTGARTTPEAADLQRQLATWRDVGIEAVVMEVSSHALVLHRVDATMFSVSIFTNLSRDHLDFHGSMEQYFEAKALLFTPSLSERAVVNMDSPYGRLIDVTRSIPTVGYAMSEAEGLRGGVDGSSFTWRDQHIELGIAGSFNVSNALAAAHAALLLGVDEETIARGLSMPITVPGRFERVRIAADYAVVVDFAHTPDGLEQVLLAAGDAVHEHEGRVIVVFGCGGDRDASKRAPMGAVAAANADIVILTADNSRSESTESIIAEISAGTERVDRRRAQRILVEPERRHAIRRALSEAGSGDIVVIAGKGHETTLTIGETVTAFDDRVVVEEVHREMGVAP
jgi:UDP-N-acetylmuramoyl-L-alanyl-D-glutamate--2,6-diaminopimelate ligase